MVERYHAALKIRESDLYFVVLLTNLRICGALFLKFKSHVVCKPTALLYFLGPIASMCLFIFHF